MLQSVLVYNLICMWWQEIPTICYEPEQRWALGYLLLKEYSARKSQWRRACKGKGGKKWTQTQAISHSHSTHPLPCTEAEVERQPSSWKLLPQSLQWLLFWTGIGAEGASITHKHNTDDLLSNLEILWLYATLTFQGLFADQQHRPQDTVHCFHLTVGVPLEIRCSGKEESSATRQ